MGEGEEVAGEATMVPPEKGEEEEASTSEVRAPVSPRKMPSLGLGGAKVRPFSEKRRETQDPLD